LVVSDVVVYELFEVLVVRVFAGAVFVCTVCGDWQPDIVIPIARTIVDFQFIAESPFCI
jgi:hypothetical protein